MCRDKSNFHKNKLDQLNTGISTSLPCKGGFTRRAKAGDNNQQTADDVKTAIPRPFTRTRQKGYYFSVIRCWRKRSAESMSVPMQNSSKSLPKTIIIIMTKKNISIL